MISRSIDHDLALKCSDDVGEAIRRNMKLAETADGIFAIALAGAVSGLAHATGSFAAIHDEPFDSEVLDAIWQGIIRPMVTAGLGDRAEFDAILKEVQP